MKRAELDALLEAVDTLVREEYFRGILAFCEMLTVCLVQSKALDAEKFDLWLTSALMTSDQLGSNGAKLLLRVREICRVPPERFAQAPSSHSLRALARLKARPARAPSAKRRRRKGA